MNKTNPITLIAFSFLILFLVGCSNEPDSSPQCQNMRTEIREIDGQEVEIGSTISEDELNEILDDPGVREFISE